MSLKTWQSDSNQVDANSSKDELKEMLENKRITNHSKRQQAWSA
jgi:hypothetical protein